MSVNGNPLGRAAGQRSRTGVAGKLRRSASVLSSAGLVVLAVTLGSSINDAGAHSGPSKWECNNRTIKGTYGIQMQGTRPAPDGTGIETLIGVVVRTYDGAGRFTQVDNVKGSVTGIVPDRPGAGTYKVNADCSAVTLFEPGPGVVIEEKLVILDYGHEIRSITTRPQPLMVSASAKRIGFR